MRYLSFIFLILFLIGCEGPKPRKPVQVKSKSFFKQSIVRSKKLLAREQDLISSVIKKDSTREYFNSPFGFSYFYEVENPTSKTQLKTDDEVRFTYALMNMDNDTIYSPEEIGVVQHAIDKSQLFPGLRNGIKLMKELEKVTFLFPSAQAYGYKGDGNKVVPSTPLKASVQLLEIIPKKDSLNLNP